MTPLGYSESITFCHSDNAPSQNLGLLVRKIVETVHRRTENRSTVNQVLLLFRTRNPLPRSSILTTHNLHLGTCNCSFRRTENRSTTNQFLLLFQTPTC